jgi:FlaA1/EpsC-like NDP-sugar epimerase
MIIGAGRATDLLLSELDYNNPYNYSIKCIIDDDETKKNRDMHNIPIVGDKNKIAEMVSKYLIELIIISMPSVDAENKKNIIEICTATKCKLKILPAICSLISSDDKLNIINKVRDVQIEDLLGRDLIILDCFLIKKYIKNKTVLITGGGGSIGSELCRQIASYSPKKIIILDIYENNIYEIQQELIRKYNDDLNIEVEIASIRDKLKLQKIFSSKKIDVVFHAAAHKHVPLMEHNPEEAVKNNIIGTYNLVLLADKYEVDKFVLISTDKAVNPTSVMGATKRVCEMIVQSFNKHSNTDFVSVRFGNVLGSNGSVIPLFIKQIKAGGPVTVTGENVTRYFMTIEEAVQLVMKAASIAKVGEIFVLDMGEPVKIKDLAYKLIKIYGLEPDIDIKVVYTGLRAGEKENEELFLNDKYVYEGSGVSKIFIEKSIDYNEEQLFEIIAEMKIAAKNNDTDLIMKLLNKAVPTFKYNYEK